MHYVFCGRKHLHEHSIHESEVMRLTVFKRKEVHVIAMINISTCQALLKNAWPYRIKQLEYFVLEKKQCLITETRDTKNTN